MKTKLLDPITQKEITPEMLQRELAIIDKQIAAAPNEHYEAMYLELRHQRKARMAKLFGVQLDKQSVK